MARLNTSFVLGYHGCEKSIGLQAIGGEIQLLESKGKSDWLGPGIYFWENDQRRAHEWAEEKKQRGELKDPFVIGAAIDLNNCLDLLVREDMELVRTAYKAFAKQQEMAGLKMPENKTAPKDPSPDLVLRFLDSAVIKHLHSMIETEGGEPFDSVRALFGEGIPLYDGSGFRHRTHIQIAVRNLGCIKGVFLPTAHGR